ncbi:MAG: hypothetical protein UX60_C0016G0007 [Berkelbacteria bacterium GW2011_GWA2_46_7]|uniref:Uncharacterized protein n=1 Tax=Berkelbacteria bacterium GW2011_GWA2_46_7 TaxID=1618335 RepID=A0A0G1TEE6_9BACT|nr:MAG: hypothetical protein UX60_C0016G0007 [Berkelbacteria bacterium GW2011_GWA2_46_7]
MAATEEEKKSEHVERLIAAIDKTYHHPGYLAWRGFLIGLASGLGATVGVAIVVGIVGLLIRQFGGLPVIGDWLNDLGRILPGS